MEWTLMTSETARPGLDWLGNTPDQETWDGWPRAADLTRNDAAPLWHEGHPRLAKAEKRIPVTEERWIELSELKRAGQTYDDLLAELIQEHNRRQLAERVRSVREMDSEELASLDKL